LRADERIAGGIHQVDQRANRSRFVQLPGQDVNRQSRPGWLRMAQGGQEPGDEVRAVLVGLLLAMGADGRLRSDLFPAVQAPANRHLTQSLPVGEQ
jgi:hypothetical protein